MKVELEIKRAAPYALSQFFMVAFQWGSLLFLPLYFKELGFSESLIGLLISSFSLSTLVLVLPLGAASDRLPPRPMMVAGAFLVIGGALAMPAGERFFPALLAVFLLGGGFTLSSIALYSLFFKQMGEEKRGLEVSIFNIGGILGAGLGVWTIGWLSREYGTGNTVLALALLSAAAWAGFAFLLPAGERLSFPILEYKQELGDPRTWVLVFIFFVTASHAGFEQAGYTLLQTEVIGLSPRTVGHIFLILSIWMSIITLWSGKKYDREERPFLMTGAALILSGIFMAASGSAKAAWDFLLFRILHTAGDSVFNLLVLVIAAIIFPRKRVGGAFAFALTVNTASYFFFANVAGVVGERFGFDRAFHLSGAIEVAAGLALLVFRSRLRKMFNMD